MRFTLEFLAIVVVSRRASAKSSARQMQKVFHSQPTCLHLRIALLDFSHDLSCHEYIVSD